MNVDDLLLDGGAAENEEAPHRRKRASSAASASGGGKSKGQAKGKAKAQKATPIRRSHSRGSSDEEAQRRPPQGAFEFAQSSRWQQLEEELAKTDMELGAKAKLREMLAHLKVAEMTG